MDRRVEHSAAVSSPPSPPPISRRLALQRFGRSLVAATGLAVAGNLLSGCMAMSSASSATVERALPPVPIPPSSIQLELMFVERPVNDPLLGSALWREMDQLAGIPADRRIALGENGFRFGLAGTEPPDTLEALLADVDDSAYDEPEGFLAGRRLVLRAGAHGDIESTTAASDWTVELTRDGRLQTTTFAAARGVIRVELRDIEAGYARLRLTPEVHHGGVLNRPTPTDDGWRYSESQVVETLSEASFELRLSLGELFTLSADDHASDRVANRFFRCECDGRLMQRVLVVRVRSIDRGGEMALR